MSLQFDYAEITRQARRLVDASRAKTVIELSAKVNTNAPRKRLKYSRSTKGCFACRKQKVKCDETAPICLRCVAAQRQCQYPHSTVGRTDGNREEGDSGRTRQSSNSGEDSLAGDIQRWNEQIEPHMSPKSALLDISKGWGTPNTCGVTLDFLKGIFKYTPDVPAIEIFPSSVPSMTTFATSQTHLFHKLPQVADLSRSSLFSRRTDKQGLTGADSPLLSAAPVAHPQPVVSPRMLVIEALLQAFAQDDSLFEFGPSKRHTSGGSISENTDMLSNAFPSPTARVLFHHFCNVTSRTLITMGNIGPNPIMALCTPLSLLDSSSAASAAIRMSILSISVSHYVHMTIESLGSSPLGSNWKTQRETLKVMGDKFKRAALSNVTLAAGSDPGTAQVDSILAACLLLCIRDVISADPSWRDNLEFALNLINKKGGPQAMLKPDEYSFTRRYLLENLATHDVFSSFITGKEPVFLGSYDTWWFDSVETSQTRWEWESVERSFGVSRAMIDLVARIAVLDSQKRRLGISIKGQDGEMMEISQHFVRESQCLLLELDIWGNSLNALPQHVRVTCGDYIYKYMATIFLLADVLEQSTRTPRIAQAVNYVLELCSEASAMRMSVMLIWPLLIAGVFCQPDVRPKVMSLFDAFRSDYCEDLIVARELLLDQWHSIDAGKGKQPWMNVMRKLGRFALLI